MHPFVYSGLPSRVLFGFGTLDKVADEVRLLDCRRALVLSTAQQAAQAEDLAARLGQLSVGSFTQAAMHTPVAVTEQAIDVLRERQADCTVALGGGSTTGLGKAIALRTDLPQIVIPTTYAGSEATPILGETAIGRKTTQRTLKVLPEVIIYDVDLTLTLPSGLSGDIGHERHRPRGRGALREGREPDHLELSPSRASQPLRGRFRTIVREPDDREARSDALFGAWLCGVCLAAVGHGAAPQALPHAGWQLRPAARGNSYGRPAARCRLQRPRRHCRRMARVARALGADEWRQGLFDLARGLGAPIALKDIGMPRERLERPPRSPPLPRTGIRGPSSATASGRCLTTPFTGGLRGARSAVEEKCPCATSTRETSPRP